ncbi:HET-domain-containing protein [Whalleya microplaca]|nr:HET-domain-containing protein [Whalleya microplaca]
MARYRYRTLPKGSHIRLATIHPGNFQDDIFITFKTSPFSRDGSLAYEALSYVWGSEDDSLSVYVCRTSIPIVIRGLLNSSGRPDAAFQRRLREIPVTRNLDVALRYLRYNDKPRVMWIDALCINQLDDSEKGSQVAMMGDIFRLASRVVAWLGPEADDSNYAVELLRGLGSEVSFHFDLGLLSPAKGCSNPSLGDRNVGLDFGVKESRSIYDLISRPWFERLWIRQEIQLANSQAVVACGYQQVNWSVFRQGLACVWAKPKPWELIDRFGSLQGFILQAENTALINIRLEFENSMCRDPRDRLYGISSLLHEDDKAIISTPDYTKSYTELYTQVTLQWFSKYGRLNLLRHCELNESALCPSWVPDWSKPGATLGTRTRVKYASSQLEAWYELRQPGTLRVMGVSSTVVKKCQLNPQLTSSGYQEIFRVIRAILLKQDLEGQYVTNISLVEAYVRTLLFDGLVDSFDPPNNDYPDLNAANLVVKQMISGYEYNQNDFIFGSARASFLKTASHALSDNQFFWGTGGYIGIAPKSAQVGDEICVLLGCELPVLLRPLGKGQYRLVGACFVLGLSYGEAFLGLLPTNIRPVHMYSEVTHNWYSGFKDIISGKTFYEDPRLKLLPLDLSRFRGQLQETREALIAIDPDILRERGVELRCFDLV